MRLADITGVRPFFFLISRRETSEYVRVTDERMLEVFEKDSIRHILRVVRIDCVPTVELRRRV